MAEGLQAGRLDVPVIADLAGFAERLRTQIEAAAEGLAAKVKVEIDDTGLREKLEAVVEAASRGVAATIHVNVDDARVRTQIEEIRQRVANADVDLPIRPDGDADRSSSGGLLGGLRRLIAGVQTEADRNPVSVPIKVKAPKGRGGSLRMLGMGALASLAEPAVALVGQYGAALTALVSSAAPAVGVLGAIPGLIAAAGTAVIGTKVAFSGFGEALKQNIQMYDQVAAGVKRTKAQEQALDASMDKLSKSARKTVVTIADLSDGWRKMRQSVQERFFSKIADDVKPLSNAVLPLLKDMLGDSASQMGSLIKRGAKFMQSGPFRKDFKTIAGSNSRVIGNLADSVGNLGHMVLDFLVASGPFVQRVGQGVERLTRWGRASVQAGRETGSLATFLDHAGDKASQLGRSTMNLIKGIGGIGKAGQDSGNLLLDGFEAATQRFNRWANSKAGQAGIAQFFAGAGPAFHELNMLVGDFVRGLGRAAKDGGVTELIRQIRTELMPAVGTFLNAVGHSIGPTVVSLVSNLATAIGNLSAAGGGLGVLLSALNGVASVFNTLMRVIPGANTTLAVFLGTLLALKVVSTVGTMIRGFGTSVAAAGTSVASLGGVMRTQLGPGQLGPQATLWQRMGGSYRAAAQEGGRLSGTLRGVGAANRVATRAIGGMTTALGGPLGLAIAGVTIGLGLLASKQEAAARATKAHEDRVNSLSQALAQSGGAIDANVRAAAAQILQDTELADGKGKLIDMMAKAGISLGDLTSAYLGQGKTLEDLQKELQATADAHKDWMVTSAGASQTWDDEGLAAIRAKNALSAVRGELEKGQAKQKQLADAANQAGTTGTDSYSRLSAAVQGFSDKTQSADTRVDNLKRALDALTGNTQSFHDAEAQLNSVMLQIDDTMKGNIEKADGWGKKLIGNDKLVNTSTRNGQTLNTQLNDLRDGMLNVATRAQEAAEKGLLPMSTAMNQSQAAMEKARAKAIQLAKDMGIPETQAKALADQMGFIPDTVTTLVTTQGMPKATADFLALRGDIEGLPPGKTLEIKAPTAEVRRQLEAVGITVVNIPGSKDIAIAAPTKAARANIAALAADIANAPNKKSVTVSAIVKKAAGELKNVQDKVTSLPAGKSIDVKAPTKTATQALKDLGFKIKTVDGTNGKVVRITAPNKTPLQQVQSIQNKINNLTGRTVTVTIRYTTQGQPYVSGNADGGVKQFVNGGINGIGRGVKRFAAGAEQHIAQVARSGEMRLWAEPETYPGEAYIPLAPSKRKRSAAILDWVAQYFGGTVVYPQKALATFANGAVSLGRSMSAANKTRSATAMGNAPLVGGDLNMTMTAEPTSPSKALQDTMFALRNIRLGGDGG
ncbi:hypothetical protein ACIP9H_33660 [Streptomyces sp. NPDC088732]|uniref:hypothetical protein n=1 Tax=Streptomyces sp. NPDC088732 TaxID=3365879 RepID=UPI003826235D